MTEQKEIDNTNEVKISVHDFYFETPLYDTIEIKNINGNFKL